MGRLGYGELGSGSNVHFVLLFSMEQEVCVSKRGKSIRSSLPLVPSAIFSSDGN